MIHVGEIMKNIFITKTNFVHFDRCHKMGWLDKFKRSIKNQPTEAEKLNIQEGYAVGDLALTHPLFKGGYMVETKRVKDALKESIEIFPKHNIIYEPAFQYTFRKESLKGLKLYLRADIIKKENGKIDLIEVKSSTRQQDIHLWDIAFQLYVLKKCGMKVGNLYLMKPNKDYKHSGTMNVKKFFTIKNVTKIITEFYLPHVEKKLEMIYKTLNNKQEPTKVLGSHCKSPWVCPFSNYCHRNINIDSVEKLSRISKKKRVGFRVNNVKYIKDIAVKKEVLSKYFGKTDFLSPRQQIQLDVALSGKPYMDMDSIKFFLKGITFPIYHLDFEAFNKAIPEYNGMRPHQFVTFQASIHKEFKSGKLEHFAFIQEDNRDPRKNMIHFLLNTVRQRGTIMVYNKSFEETRIRELANDFPKFKTQLLALIPRLVDLEIPFKKHYYVHEFEGRSSIKKVLPVMCPELSYDRLNIQNGSDAQAIYRNLINKVYHTDKGYKGKQFEKVKQDLLDYCGQDTIAMVELLKALRNLVAKEEKKRLAIKKGLETKRKNALAKKRKEMKKK